MLFFIGLSCRRRGNTDTFPPHCTNLTHLLIYLVEDVVVLLGGDRPDHPALVEEVAVDLCPVESSVAHLNLDEVALQY